MVNIPDFEDTREIAFQEFEKCADAFLEDRFAQEYEKESDLREHYDALSPSAKKMVKGVFKSTYLWAISDYIFKKGFWENK